MKIFSSTALPSGLVCGGRFSGVWLSSKRCCSTSASFLFFFFFFLLLFLFHSVSNIFSTVILAVFEIGACLLGGLEMETTERSSWRSHLLNVLLFSTFFSRGGGGFMCFASDRWAKRSRLLVQGRGENFRREVKMCMSQTQKKKHGSAKLLESEAKTSRRQKLNQPTKKKNTKENERGGTSR